MKRPQATAMAVLQMDLMFTPWNSTVLPVATRRPHDARDLTPSSPRPRQAPAPPSSSALGLRPHGELIASGFPEMEPATAWESEDRLDHLATCGLDLAERNGRTPRRRARNPRTYSRMPIRRTV